MPIAKPCPKSCKFDWVAFHSQLDLAMAHLIEEAEPDAHIEDYGPSHVSILQFAEYSNAKKRLQELNRGPDDRLVKPEDRRG